MKFISRQVVFQEVPDEISLAYLMSGCPQRCEDCHSSHSWNSNAGLPLTKAQLEQDLEKYDGWITCVLFLGGEWSPIELREHLKLVKQRGLKTCLYTGQDFVSEKLMTELDYIKTGSYIRELGGLDSPTTNQKLMEVKTGKVLNSFFTQGRSTSYDSTQRKAASGEN